MVRLPALHISGAPEGSAGQVPPGIVADLMATTTPEELMQKIRTHEPKLAAQIGYGEFLDCDQAASIMSDVLKAKGIAHSTVVGNSDEGSSHAWVRIGRKNYDATEQGFGDGRGKVVEKYAGQVWA